MGISPSRVARVVASGICLGWPLLVKAAWCQQQEGKRDSILVDHAGRVAWYWAADAKVSKQLKQGSEVKVKAGRPVVIKVTKTNSALYDYTARAERVAEPSATALSTFLAALYPYGLELGRIFGPRLKLLHEDVAALEFRSRCPLVDAVGQNLNRYAKSWRTRMASTGSMAPPFGCCGGWSRGLSPRRQRNSARRCT